MTEQAKAFLKIEKLVKGKVERCEQWQEVPLGTDALLIARPSSEPDAIDPDIKIVGDDYISRKPIEIHYSFSDKCYMLCDHGTSNGTFLNGELIESDGRLYRLKDYDLIGLAKVRGEMRVLLRFRTSHKTQPGWVDEEPYRPLVSKGLSVNLGARRVFVDGKEVPLTRTEWKVFQVLFINRGKSSTMDDIIWEVWGSEGALPELVAKYIQRLRDKIEPDRSRPRYIKTNPAGGYILEI
jgi:hypothetical protein